VEPFGAPAKGEITMGDKGIKKESIKRGQITERIRKISLCIGLDENEIRQKLKEKFNGIPTQGSSMDELIQIEDFLIDWQWLIYSEIWKQFGREDFHE
jgi:hypothetical protein